MTREQYFMMCEQLGSEPIPSEIPAAFEDFPYEVQQAISIYTILPDMFEGMSGTYMGKDYSLLPYLLEEIFEVYDKKQTMQILLMIGNTIKNIHSKEQEKIKNKDKKKGKGIHVKG